MSSQIPNEAFDIILANINRNVILDYVSQLTNGLKENGYLLLSGLLSVDEKDIVEAFQHEKLKFFKRTERNNWISLLLIKII
jgi:ribosomal protein L11 methyltransferase